MPKNVDIYDQKTGQWFRNVLIPGEQVRPRDVQLLREMVRREAIEPNRPDTGPAPTPGTAPQKSPPLINPYLGPSAAMANRLTRIGSARGMVERPRYIADFRAPMIMAGATAGAAAGMPFALPSAGAIPAATAIGGAGVGTLAHDVATHYGRKLGLVGPGKFLEDDPRYGATGGQFGPTTRALNEMALEGTFPFAVGGVRRAGLAAMRGTAGLRGEVMARARRVAGYGEEIGIPLGMENLSPSGIYRFPRSILGRIPWFSKHFTRLDKEQGRAILQRQEQLVSHIAPVVKTVTETGTNMATNALRRARGYAKYFKHEYDGFIADAERAGARIPSTEVRQAARDLFDDFSERLPRMRHETKAGVKIKPIEPPPGEDEEKIIEWARDNLTNLTDDMSAAQYRRLARSLNELMVRYSDTPVAAGKAAALRKALEQDLENIIGPPELVTRIRRLNREYSAYAKILEGPTGQRIGRAERGVLGHLNFQKHKTIEHDELFKAAMNVNSPDALRDLHRLVGPSAFRNATRRHVENVFSEGIEEGMKESKNQVIRLSFVKKALGIGKEGSARRSAFAEMLKLNKTRTTIRDWEKFFEVTEAALSQKTIDVSQFLARRVVLSGAQRGLRAINPANIFTSGRSFAATGTAAGVGTGIFLGSGPVSFATSLMLAFGARSGLNRVLTNPAALRAATRAIDPDLAPGVNAQAAARFVRLMGREAIDNMGEAINQFARQKTQEAQEFTGDIRERVLQIGEGR
jgi:hypothetical protein